MPPKRSTSDTTLAPAEGRAKRMRSLMLKDVAKDPSALTGYKALGNKNDSNHEFAMTFVSDSMGNMSATQEAADSLKTVLN